MTFAPIDLATANLVAYTDASWANNEDLRSQAGFLVFLTGPDVLSVEGDFASLLDWRSHRIQRRRCRSTLAAETMAMDAGMDSALFTRELLAEVLLQDYKATQCGKLPPWFLTPHVVTDCRSLYDLVTKDGPLAATQEKRLTLDIGAIKESAVEHCSPVELEHKFKALHVSHSLNSLKGVSTGDYVGDYYRGYLRASGSVRRPRERKW